MTKNNTQLVEAKTKDASLNALARQMFESGLDLGGRRPERPRQSYSQVTWVYICINAITSAAASIQMMISTADDKIVESGPAYDLLFRQTSFTTFITDTIGFWRLFGAAYWVFDELENNSITPAKISVVSPLQMQPVLRRGILIGWRLRTNSGDFKYYTIGEVYPVTSFNPYSSLKGVAPTEPAELAISSSYQSSLYNEAMFANGGKVGNVITTPGQLQEEQARFLRAQFEARHKGPSNAGKTAILTAGADIKTIAQTMADMQAAELRNFDAAEVCAAFGVPKEIANLNSEAQYAHGPAQQRFIVNTITPLLAVLADHITIGILTRFKSKKSVGLDFKSCKSYPGTTNLPLTGKSSFRVSRAKAVRAGQDLYAWFAVEEHPTVQAVMQEKIEKVLKYTESGVPLNMLIDSFDLPFEPVPWGNDWWINMGLVPARFTLEEGITASTGPGQPEGQTDDDDDRIDDDEKSITVEDSQICEKDSAERLRIWRAYVASMRPLERSYTGKVTSYFQRQKRECLDRLKKALGEKASYKDASDIVMQVIFDLKVENKKITAINKAQFRTAAELGIRQAITEVADLTASQLNDAAASILSSPQATAAMAKSSNAIKKINSTTKKWITEQLTEGLKKGEGLSELSSRLRSDRSFTLARAKRIARTQVSGAVSAGRQAGQEQAGVEKKSWITSGDSEVRATHKAVAAATADGIDISDRYEVGTSSLMYPGDPAGSPAETANCRCVSIAKIVKGKTFGVKFYAGRKFYDLTDMQRDKQCQN